MKFSIKDFFSKYDQIRSFLRILSHLLKKSLIENFILCAVNSLGGPGLFWNLGEPKLFGETHNSTVYRAPAWLRDNPESSLLLCLTDQSYKPSPEEIFFWNQ